MNLIIALNYGGRADILNAVQNILHDKIEPEEISEKLFSQYLYTDTIPDPDLIIRTGAEMRVSNFLLWQGAYSEYYFTAALWPEFNENEIEKRLSHIDKEKDALADYKDKHYRSERNRIS